MHVNTACNKLTIDHSRVQGERKGNVNVFDFEIGPANEGASPRLSKVVRGTELPLGAFLSRTHNGSEQSCLPASKSPLPCSQSNSQQSWCLGHARLSLHHWDKSSLTCSSFTVFPIKLPLDLHTLDLVVWSTTAMLVIKSTSFTSYLGFPLQGGPLARLLSLASWGHLI